MSDPAAQIIALLEPVATFTKLVSAYGSWSVKREEVGRPFYCAVLAGSFRLAAPGLAPITLDEGDFILLPLAREFETFSLDRAPGDLRESMPVGSGPGVVQIGETGTHAEVRQLVGYGAFGFDNAALLTALLPPVLHVRGEARLATLVRLIDEEARADRAARTEVLTHLLHLVLIEAIRSTGGSGAPRGLLPGLADERLSHALRAMHAAPSEPWTVPRLAAAAGLSRTAFFSRFARIVGMAPMRYLSHWRMLLAKRLLLEMSASEVADRIGYASVSTFSTAFSKHTGRSPAAYLRQRRSGPCQMSVAASGAALDRGTDESGGDGQRISLGTA